MELRKKFTGDTVLPLQARFLGIVGIVGRNGAGQPEAPPDQEQADQEARSGLNRKVKRILIRGEMLDALSMPDQPCGISGQQGVDPSEKSEKDQQEAPGHRLGGSVVDRHAFRARRQ